MAYFTLNLSSSRPGPCPTGNVQLVVDGTPVVGAAATLDGSCTAVVFSTATIDASPVAHQRCLCNTVATLTTLKAISNTVSFTVSADTTR